MNWCPSIAVSSTSYSDMSAIMIVISKS